MTRIADTRPGTGVKRRAEAAEKPKTEMTIESLAVKYRPKVLEDLVGQDSIVTQIRGMLRRQRFPASILLAGGTGTGKTTTARMIARYMQCKNPDPTTYAPCGECISCKYENDHPDVMELNVADARGIDDMRALIKAAQNMPTMGKCRVFILDEFHQATPQAVQSMLKILEEPPKHTMWIMATTDPEKLPHTVVGRCTRFHVQQIQPAELHKRLTRIARREGVDYKSIEQWPNLMKMIGDLSYGHMRDAIQMLESVVYALDSDKDVDAKLVIKQFMETGEAQLEEGAARLLLNILTRNHKGAFKEVRSCEKPRDLIYKLRWLIMYLTDNSVGLAKYTPYSAKYFARIAKDTEVKVNLTFLLKVQYLLIDVERTLNLINGDPAVVMPAMICDFVERNKKAAE